ncbi:aldo/keto reductase [Streptomyces olivochromogenes]|uniref:aldo/keto reductase n=1 Tax=Streptomyces olivochromogenes TaxID=1963 RepID=UPI0035B45706
MFTAYAEARGNVIDTANRYREGGSERIVGELLGSDRDRFVLSMKYMLAMDGTAPNAAGNHDKNLIRCVEASPRRLGTDYIDLLWVHIWEVVNNSRGDWPGPRPSQWPTPWDRLRAGSATH